MCEASHISTTWAACRWVKHIHFSLGTIANANGTFLGKAIGPETFNGSSGARHLVMRSQQPESEDGLGQNIEDGVADDLSIHVHQAGSITNAPNTEVSSVLVF